MRSTAARHPATRRRRAPSAACGCRPPRRPPSSGPCRGTARSARRSCPARRCASRSRAASSTVGSHSVSTRSTLRPAQRVEHGRAWRRPRRPTSRSARSRRAPAWRTSGSASTRLVADADDAGAHLGQAAGEQRHLARVAGRGHHHVDQHPAPRRIVEISSLERLARRPRCRGRGRSRSRRPRTCRSVGRRRPGSRASTTSAARRLADLVEAVGGDDRRPGPWARR